jgi:hypothetical protein
MTHKCEHHGKCHRGPRGKRGHRGRPGQPGRPQASDQIISKDGTSKATALNNNLFEIQNTASGLVFQSNATDTRVLHSPATELDLNANAASLAVADTDVTLGATSASLTVDNEAILGITANHTTVLAAGGFPRIDLLPPNEITLGFSPGNSVRVSDSGMAVIDASVFGDAAAPTATLDVKGTLQNAFRLQDTSEGAGKVLGCFSGGFASWIDPLTLPLARGFFYFTSPFTVAIPGGIVPLAGASTQGPCLDFVMSGAGVLQYIGATPKIFQVNITVAMGTTSPVPPVVGQVFGFLNGSPIPGAFSIVLLQPQAPSLQYFEIPLTFTVALSMNDQLRIAVTQSVSGSLVILQGAMTAG